MEQYKTCNGCKQVLPLDDFHNQKQAKDGKKSQCKKCSIAKVTEYQRANKDKVLARIYAWQQENPEKVAHYRKKCREDRKEKDKVYRQAYYQANKDARRAYYREYRLQNLDKLYIKGKTWREANPDKVRKYSSQRRSRQKNAITFVITSKEIAKLITAPCFYCNQPGGTLDHVIPLIRGGTHGIGNLVSACESCNKSKAAKCITEWKKVRGW